MSTRLDPEPPVKAAARTLTLTLAGKTATTLTLSWTPPRGATGYTFLRDGVKLSSTKSGTLSKVKFGVPDAKSHVYTVAAVGVNVAGSYTYPVVTPPPPPPPPPPPTTTNTVVIYDNDSNKAADWAAISALGVNTLICGADDPQSLTALQAAGGKAWATCGYWNDSAGEFSHTDAEALAMAQTAVKNYPGVITGWYVADEPSAGHAAKVKARADLLRSVLAVETVIASWDTSTFAEYKSTVTAFAIDGYPNRDNWNQGDITSRASAADTLGIRYYGVLGAFTDGGVYLLPTATQLQQMINTWKSTKQVGAAIYEWGPAGGPTSSYLENHPELTAVLKANYASVSRGSHAPKPPVGPFKSAGTTWYRNAASPVEITGLDVENQKGNVVGIGVMQWPIQDGAIPPGGFHLHDCITKNNGNLPTTSDGTSEAGVWAGQPGVYERFLAGGTWEDLWCGAMLHDSVIRDWSTSGTSTVAGAYLEHCNFRNLFEYFDVVASSWKKGFILEWWYADSTYAAWAAKNYPTALAGKAGSAHNTIQNGRIYCPANGYGVFADAGSWGNIVQAGADGLEFYGPGGAVAFPNHLAGPDDNALIEAGVTFNQTGPRLTKHNNQVGEVAGGVYGIDPAVKHLYGGVDTRRAPTKDELLARDTLRWAKLTV